MKGNIDPADVKPCRHMEILVSAWLDGALDGVARWYTQRHVRDCRQCRASLPFLRSLRARLLAVGIGDEPALEMSHIRLPALNGERWAKIGTHWDGLEKRKASGEMHEGGEGAPLNEPNNPWR